MCNVNIIKKIIYYYYFNFIFVASNWIIGINSYSPMMVSVANGFDLYSGLYSSILSISYFCNEISFLLITPAMNRTLV